MTSMAFDPAVVEFIRDLAPVWLALLLAALSFLGSTMYQLPVLLAIYAFDTREKVLTWLGIVLGSYSFRSVLKHANDTSRPPVDPPVATETLPWVIRPVYEHPAEIATTSFPSGHAIAATVLWGLLVVDTEVGTRRQRLAIAGSVITIVAVSRVVLAAHYVEDVVAGVFFGALFLWGALWLRNRSTQPVTAAFALAAVVSLLTAVPNESTTGSAVLGAAIGILLVRNSDTLRQQCDRTHRQVAVGAYGAVTVTIGALVAMSAIIVPLFVGGLVGGIACYWIPRQPAFRQRVARLPLNRSSGSSGT